jgi:transposase
MTMDRIEVITSVERRRRWNRAEKARLVAAMEEPGAVVTEIARGAEVNASLLYCWRRELRGARHKTPMFVPVRIAREASDESPASAPGTPSSPSSQPQPPPAPRSSITIAFGVEIRMTIEGSTLPRVIGALTASDRFR